MTEIGRHLPAILIKFLPLKRQLDPDTGPSRHRQIGAANGSFRCTADAQARKDDRASYGLWPIVLTGVRATLLPLKKPWFSVNVGLLAQTPTHSIGQ